MEVIFYSGIVYQADFLLYNLEKYGKNNSFVLDFPVGGSNQSNGLVFLFKEPNTLAQITVIAIYTSTDEASTAGILYRQVRQHVNPEQYRNLADDFTLEYAQAVSKKIFSYEVSLSDSKNELENFLTKQGYIWNLIYQVPPKEFTDRFYKNRQ